MRTLPLLGALAVGLGLTGQVTAQNTTNLFQSNYASTATSSLLYKQNYASSISNPTRPINNNRLLTSTNSAFSLRDLFSRVPSAQARPDTTFAPIPDPNTKTADYLAAFGYKPLGRRR